MPKCENCLFWQSNGRKLGRCNIELPRYINTGASRSTHYNDGCSIGSPIKKENIMGKHEDLSHDPEAERRAVEEENNRRAPHQSAVDEAMKVSEKAGHDGHKGTGNW